VIAPAWSSLVPAACLLAACAGCHNNPHAKPDAAVDAKVDAKLDAAIDSGPCSAGQVLFTGEYVDWNSTTASFCGVFSATLAEDSDPQDSDMTAPNGRFKLCVPGTARTRIDITNPSGASPCDPSPGSYSTTMPGITIADPAVIATGQIISYRDFTTTVAATLNLTAGDAQLFVHVDGTAAAITLSEASAGSAMYFDGTTWSTMMPATIVNVFYPNLDPTPGSVTVTMTGATGNGSVPIAANAISYITVVGN
jgi:hypothetical protein